MFDVYRDSQVNTVKYTLENDSLSWFVKRCHIWQGKVWLIDLNPFGEVTDSLLFTWDELTSGGEVAQQQQVTSDPGELCWVQIFSRARR